MWAQTVENVSISIHTPLAGSDLAVDRQGPAIFEFQSTLPLRGATQPRKYMTNLFLISIHTPLAGSDNTKITATTSMTNFNPHSPCGERRCGIVLTLTPMNYFNPHSPCGERRCGIVLTLTPMNYFNPHSPCGERPTSPACSLISTKFQSTLPLRGATTFPHDSTQSRRFQSTLPLRGATAGRCRVRWIRCYFNPHSPCGERPSITPRRASRMLFQSTLPLRGATRPSFLACAVTVLFQSTLPLRGATHF